MKPDKIEYPLRFHFCKTVARESSWLGGWGLREIEEGIPKRHRNLGRMMGVFSIRIRLWPVHTLNMYSLGVPLWLSGLRIQCSHCCDVGSVPGLGTSSCPRHSQKYIYIYIYV